MQKIQDVIYRSMTRERSLPKPVLSVEEQKISKQRDDSTALSLKMKRASTTDNGCSLTGNLILSLGSGLDETPPETSLKYYNKAKKKQADKQNKRIGKKLF